ncbi:hypothetical protein CGK74_07875 [Thauera propionica]|uniref:Uncharacterized protein n=1 Tax=Thauera propionica TaxID=2019431 RepID=A0A235F1G0_9RHOO|nr:hypothetical protein [Thauera propionica]OYD54687.1 hypothetical protein CGK74_07875 [Thauera propionica]
MTIANTSDRRSGNDRRSGIDRRTTLGGPPSGIGERRKRPEPRLPEVSELALSDEEWQAMFGAGIAKPA